MGVIDYLTSLLIKSLLGGNDTLDCKFSQMLFDTNLLEITEPICECIFDQTKHPIVIVLASGLTLLSF